MMPTEDKCVGVYVAGKLSVTCLSLVEQEEPFVRSLFLESCIACVDTWHELYLSNI